MWRDLLQEAKELGLGGTAFRLSWEFRTRTGIAGWRKDPPLSSDTTTPRLWLSRLPISDSVSVADAMRERIPKENLAQLRDIAASARRGTVLCFGRFPADFGWPLDWHLNPSTNERWNSQLNWTRVLRDEPRVGDVKMSWEAGRFPHAYHLARDAAYHPENASLNAQSLFAQMVHFFETNPYGLGIHWASGQEISIRLLAWLFALRTLLSREDMGEEATAFVERAMIKGATHIERHIDYARKAVYNNHALSEAIALYATGVLFPHTEHGRRFRKKGRRILEEETARQFYQDGAYIQLSHNYHRVALQYLLWASLFAKAAGDAPAPVWLKALEGTIDFLLAHQNPDDGSLPNYGANDGALHSIFTTCNFSDFRPTLQAANVMARGERLYPPGPWDETLAWTQGAYALDAPLRPRKKRSISFATTGFHVLRSDNENTFSTFRCGTVKDRFSQIDMLHVDVYWKGHNVLVDGGSYLYNGPQAWHRHFYGTQSHNTLMVDGLDQMLHFRRFKNLYWTQARLLQFETGNHFVLASGEHEGFQRHIPGCLHRRSVLQAGSNLWVVADTLFGEGSHHVRLHWLGGNFPHHALNPSGMALTTPSGIFSIKTFNTQGFPLTGTLVRGQENPPRGWQARFYGHKDAVPSLVVEYRSLLPVTLLTLMGEDNVSLKSLEGVFEAQSASSQVQFRLQDGLLVPLSVTEHAIASPESPGS